MKGIKETDKVDRVVAAIERQMEFHKRSTGLYETKRSRTLSVYRPVVDCCVGSFYFTRITRHETTTLRMIQIDGDSHRRTSRRLVKLWSGQVRDVGFVVPVFVSGRRRRSIPTAKLYTALIDPSCLFWIIDSSPGFLASPWLPDWLPVLGRSTLVIPWVDP